MKRWLFATSLVALALCTPETGAAQALADRYRDAASRIIARATRDSAAWNRIATLTETFGHRFSGSGVPQSGRSTGRWPR
jgi:carboxypeptidase Q